MAETKFKITLNETGQSITKEVLGYKIAFFNHKWSYDKEGKETINKAELSETVYFHTEITGLPNKTQLEFKLYEHDNFFPDSLNDDKFNEEEVIIKTEVIEKGGIRKASIKLYLDEKWEGMLKKDTAYDLDLYWQVYFKLPNYDTNLWAKVPKKEEERLQVEFNSRTLFFKPSIAGGKLPQLIANDGSPLFLAELKEATIDEVEDIAKSRIKDKVKKKAEELVNSAVVGYNNAIESKVTTIALAKLAKGTMVDTNGKIHTKSRKIYQYTEEVFNKEVIVKRGRRFDNGIVKSAANQAHYFATNGTNVEILNTLRIRPLMSAEDASEAFSKIFSLVDFSMMSLEEITDTPLNVPDFLLKRFLPKTPIVGISLWLEFLGYVALVEHEKQEAMVDQIMQEKLERAKTKGLDALRTFLHVYETEYDLIAVSNKTLSALLLGKFRTLKKLNDYESEQKFSTKNVQILHKAVYGEEKGRFDYVIESIFIDK